MSPRKARHRGLRTSARHEIIGPLIIREVPWASGQVSGRPARKRRVGAILRSSGSDLNGMPQLATPTAADVLQASLQHVVLTYDPVNGRQIFVNGVSTGVMDPQKGTVVFDGAPAALAAQPELLERHLGV